jgi:hypothetical protein
MVGASFMVVADYSVPELMPFFFAVIIQYRVPGGKAVINLCVRDVILGKISMFL